MVSINLMRITIQKYYSVKIKYSVQEQLVQLPKKLHLDLLKVILMTKVFINVVQKWIV